MLTRGPFPKQERRQAHAGLAEVEGKDGRRKREVEPVHASAVPEKFRTLCLGA